MTSIPIGQRRERFHESRNQPACASVPFYREPWASAQRSTPILAEWKLTDTEML